MRTQSFTDGRDAVLAQSRHVRDRVKLGEKTGVEKPLLGPDEAQAAPARALVDRRLGG